MNKFVDIIFEAGALKRIKRTPVQNPYITGESVAEHSHRVAIIAAYLAKIEEADMGKVLLMATFHDLTEVRCADTNRIQKPYVDRDEEKASNEIYNDFENSEYFKKLMEEYAERQSLESQIVKDADNIEFIASLKENLRTVDLLKQEIA